MKKQWTLFFIGLFVLFLPFLGFPPSWKTFFYVIGGGAVAVISFLEIRRAYLGGSSSSQSGQRERGKEDEGQA